MYFQVSPIRSIKPKHTKSIKTQEDEIVTLRLAPFSEIPKLSFHHVPINVSCKIELVLTNPRQTSVKVNVFFDGPDDIGLSLSWNEEVIEGNSETTLELSWLPNNGYSGRHSLRLTCQKQFWNIPLVFKTASPKKPKGKKKISTTLVKKSSPILKTDKKSSQKLSIPSFKSTFNRNPVWNTTPYASKKTICNKENITTSDNFVSPSNVSFYLHPADNIRRYTYAINNSKMPEKKLPSPKFDDSLELNGSDIQLSPDKNRPVLKQIHFNNTPSLEELLLHQKLNYQSCVTTPVSQFFCPRRVSTEIVKKDEYKIHITENSHLVRNLSFELKSTSKTSLPSINISSETHVVGNLSLESTERVLDSNTFVKSNISSGTSTETLIHRKHSNSPFRNGFKNILNLSPVSSEQQLFEITRSNEHDDTKFLNNGQIASTSTQEFSTLKCFGNEEIMKNLRVKRKSDGNFTISPSKRQNLSPETWSKVGCIYSARMSTHKAKLIKNNSSCIDQPDKFKGISFVEKVTLAIKDPFILAATISFDPFLTNTIYLDQDWIEEQEHRFKRWFNILLTPPSELKVTDESQNIDAAKLWRECTRKEVALAPTKEVICNEYHVLSRLDILRETASKFYMSEEIQEVLSKFGNAIEKGKLEIRQDKNVHLDLSLQSKLMSLLLSYNPLWLRIGLETIYKIKLQLASNSDVIGLSKFLYDRFFKDPRLFKIHKTVHSLKYNTEIKKFILKKYLTLVYLLDKAKIKKLIGHDPCLFRRNAVVKESRDMLIHFAKEAITGGVGDINKYLKYFGYVVHHKQLYIHEYDYAVNNLGGDLRDGVRLTRVMEIISMNNGLTEQLRVPAISRLQKIHNVKLVFKCLANQGYEIQHEIEPYHIVDGHREKTLSFLWQIIYKFQAPLMLKSVKTIQTWWRSFPIHLKRNRLRKNYQAKVDSATKIQRWFRRNNLSRKLLIYSSFLKKYLIYVKREKAAIKIQSYFKMLLQQKRYLNIKRSVLKLQKQCRFWLNSVYYRKRVCASIVLQKNIRTFLARSRYMQLKKTVLIIEQMYVAKKLMMKEKQHYQQLRSSAIIIQQWYKACNIAKPVRTDYLQLKRSVSFLQEKFRSKQLMRKAVNEYRNLKSSTILIQSWYRSVKLMQRSRNDFLQMKNSAMTIEKYFIAYREMKKARACYLSLRKGTILIQIYFKATLQMRHERQEFLSMKKASEFIKSKYKANKSMFIAKQNFQILKRAAIFIQRQFRANKLMKIDRTSYLKLKESTVTIQMNFKRYLLMRKTRQSYLHMKTNAIIIQQKFRAYRKMCCIKKEYETFRKTVIWVQTKFRCNRLMKIQREKFLIEKKSCITIQNHFRCFLQMKKERKHYLSLAAVVRLVQQKYRAKRSMKICKESYIKLKQVSIMLQRRFRANKLMNIQKKAYLQLKSTVNFVKDKYKAKQMMLRARRDFQQLRETVIFIQRRFRANRAMQIEKTLYLQQKRSAIIIQKYFRMKKQRNIYLRMKWSITKLQQWYRGHKAMLLAKDYFRNLRNAVILVQRRYRANKIMKIERDLFLKQKNAVITIQNIFRSYLLMKNSRKLYLEMKSSAVIIQRRYRAHKAQLTASHNFQNLKTATVFVQRLFRAMRIMKIERGVFLQQRKAVFVIQGYFRSYLIMKKERKIYTEMKKSASIIERWYAAYRSMSHARQKYIVLKKAVILIQCKYRANKLMQTQRKMFLNKRKCCVIIQRYYRSFILMKKERKEYLQLKMTVRIVEEKYIAIMSMQTHRAIYVKLKEVTLFIQRKFRATKTMKVHRIAFLEQRQAVLKIQRFFRGYQEIKFYRAYFLNSIKAIVTIQTFARGFIIRRSYAHLLTPAAKEERRLKKIQEAAAIKIQAHWRGYSQRSKDEHCWKVIRKKCRDAQTKANPNFSLESRSARALELLVSEDITIPLIISALSDFEYVTRRSPVTCKKMGSILAEQLYLLNKSVSRSLPEIQINVLSTYILINLCKYPPTTKETWCPKHFDSMVDIMLHWCDKEEMIFPGLCTLFWLFAHNREYKQVILELPHLDHKLNKIKGLVMRKQKMVSRSEKKVLFSKFHGTKSLKLPGLKPDWGFDYPDRPRTFTNSVYAIQCLEEILKS